MMSTGWDGKLWIGIVIGLLVGGCGQTESTPEKSNLFLNPLIMEIVK
jgi:hypothetical protein